MSKEEKTPLKPTMHALNEDAMKGILVDGLGIHVGKDYAILEGIISKPRSEVPIVASRMIIPIQALEALNTGIVEVLKKRKEWLEQSEKKAEK